MVVSLLLSRVLGIVRDQVMVWSFGRNELTDAYRWAFQIPDLIFFAVAGGALSSAFIPVFSEYLHTDREEDAWHVFSAVTTIMSLIVLGFIALAWIYALPLTHVIAPGSEADPVRPLIAHMSRIILPAQFAFFVGGLMFGTLYARQVFSVPGLGPNVYNIGIIFGALVLAHLVTPGIVGMSWGALVGAFVGNLVIPYFAMRKLVSKFRLSLDWRHPGVKKVFRLMLPVVLGLSLPGVYGMIMQAFSSFFPKGTATALDLSNKLMQAPLGVFGQSLAIAAFPALSQFFAQGRMDLYRDQMAKTLRQVIFITLPISVLFVVFSPELITLLFQYGKKFGATDTAAVAGALQMFGLGITFWCLHPVLMRGFFAVQNSVTPIVLGTATTVLFVGLCLGLMQTPLGYRALPLASSISAVALAAFLLWGLRRQAGDLDVRGILQTLGKGLVGAAAMTAILLVGDRVIPTGSGLGANLTALLKFGGIGLVGVWAYIFVANRLGMPETEFVRRAMARLDRRKGKE